MLEFSKHKLKAFGRDEDAAITIWGIFLIVFSLGFIGLSCEMMLLETERNKSQHAADIAALAAMSYGETTIYDPSTATSKTQNREDLAKAFFDFQKSPTAENITFNFTTSGGVPSLTIDGLVHTDRIFSSLLAVKQGRFENAIHTKVTRAIGAPGIHEIIITFPLFPNDATIGTHDDDGFYADPFLDTVPIDGLKKLLKETIDKIIKTDDPDNWDTIVTLIPYGMNVNLGREGDGGESVWDELTSGSSTTPGVTTWEIEQSNGEVINLKDNADVQCIKFEDGWIPGTDTLDDYAISQIANDNTQTPMEADISTVAKKSSDPNATTITLSQQWWHGLYPIVNMASVDVSEGIVSDYRWQYYRKVPSVEWLSPEIIENPEVAWPSRIYGPDGWYRQCDSSAIPGQRSTQKPHPGYDHGNEAFPKSVCSSIDDFNFLGLRQASLTHQNEPYRQVQYVNFAADHKDYPGTYDAPNPWNYLKSQNESEHVDSNDEHKMSFTCPNPDSAATFASNNAQTLKEQIDGYKVRFGNNAAAALKWTSIALDPNSQDVFSNVISSILKDKHSFPADFNNENVKKTVIFFGSETHSWFNPHWSGEPQLLPRLYEGDTPANKETRRAFYEDKKYFGDYLKNNWAYNEVFNTSSGYQLKHTLATGKDDSAVTIVPELKNLYDRFHSRPFSFYLTTHAGHERDAVLDISHSDRKVVRPYAFSDFSVEAPNDWQRFSYPWETLPPLCDLLKKKNVTMYTVNIGLSRKHSNYPFNFNDVRIHDKAMDYNKERLQNCASVNQEQEKLYTEFFRQQLYYFATGDSSLAHHFESAKNNYFAIIDDIFKGGGQEYVKLIE